MTSITANKSLLCFNKSLSYHIDSINCSAGDNTLYTSFTYRNTQIESTQQFRLEYTLKSNPNSDPIVHIVGVEKCQYIYDENKYIVSTTHLSIDTTYANITDIINDIKFITLLDMYLLSDEVFIFYLKEK